MSLLSVLFLFVILITVTTITVNYQVPTNMAQAQPYMPNMAGQMMNRKTNSYLNSLNSLLKNECCSKNYQTKKLIKIRSTNRAASVYTRSAYVAVVSPSKVLFKRINIICYCLLCIKYIYNT